MLQILGTFLSLPLPTIETIFRQNVLAKLKCQDRLKVEIFESSITSCTERIIIQNHIIQLVSMNVIITCEKGLIFT